MLRPCQRPLWPRYSGGAERLSEIDPPETKIALFFSLFAPQRCVVYFHFCMHEGRAFVEIQPTQAFYCPGISTLTERGVNRADAPYCPGGVASIEQWKNAVKVTLK